MEHWKSRNLHKIFETKERRKVNEKAKRIIKENYKELRIEKQASLENLLCELRADTHFSKLIYKLNNIKTEYLYESHVHGQEHAERVTVLSAILLQYAGIRGRSWERCIDMAMYHDIGRIDDSEDYLHGLRGAEKIPKICPDYQTWEHKIMMAVLEAHSLSEQKADEIYDKYLGGDRKYYKEYANALRIIKDADALDRFRLTEHSLDVNFLRTKEAEGLVLAACEMELYQDEIE